MIQKNDHKCHICAEPYALGHGYFSTPSHKKIYKKESKYINHNLNTTYPIFKISRTIKTFKLLDTGMALFMIYSTT